MASDNDAKRRIVEELEKIRGDLAGASAELRDQLNFQRRFSEAWQRYRWIWLSFIALFGWVLFRLPSRTKKIYSKKGRGVAQGPPTGKSLTRTTGGQRWRRGYTIGKPAPVAVLPQTSA